jgi:DNA-binding NarL/FixJ family response regulator
VAEHARTSAAMQPERALQALSPREREVFLLAAKGLRNGEIAAAASISETTVKTHVSSILAKLDLRSRAQIVVHAYENRLLSA